MLSLLLLLYASNVIFRGKCVVVWEVDLWMRVWLRAFLISLSYSLSLFLHLCVRTLSHLLHKVRLHSVLFPLWSRRQKEKRINPPSAAMGSPPLCSPTGHAPSPHTHHHQQHPHIFGHGLSLSSSTGPLSLVTSFSSASSPQNPPSSTSSDVAVVKRE